MISTLTPAGDRRLLVLWDIDHTLVDTRGVSREAYEVAFADITGMRMPKVDMTGRTDRAIMTEALSLAGVTVTATVLADFRRGLAAALMARRGELFRRGRALPGAGTVLYALSLKSPWVVQTVLTGNIARTAATKLLVFGLDIHLDLTLGAYGGRRLDRADLIDDARRAFAHRYPHEPAPHVVVVGDSVFDVDGARRRGARCVATATGSHTTVSLAAAGAHVVLDDLRDVDSAVDAICDWEGGKAMTARTGDSKLVLPADLPALRSRYRESGATVGHCHGCFDILHHGHVHHLTRAATEVDVLIVSVTPARFIDKGPGRPVFGDDARLAVLAALEVVDHVVLNDAPTAESLIRVLRPDVFFKGPDYAVTDDPRVRAEIAAVAEVGARHAMTDALVTDSSTRAARLLGAGASR